MTQERIRGHKERITSKGNEALLSLHCANIYCSCMASNFEIHYLCIYSFATKKQNSVFWVDLKRLIWTLTFHEDLRGTFTAGGVSRVLRDRGITCGRETRFTHEPSPEPEIWGSYLSRMGRRSWKSLSTAHAEDSSGARTHGAPAGGSEIPEGLSWFPVLLCICNKHKHTHTFAMHCHHAFAWQIAAKYLGSGFDPVRRHRGSCPRLYLQIIACVCGVCTQRNGSVRRN